MAFTNQTLSELVQYVRSRSPFYASLYEHLPSGFQGIESLPLIDNDSYWKPSNSDENSIITEPLTDAVIMRSGGSTSVPKTVYMTRHEFHIASQINGVSFAQSCGIISGDRIANLSSQGGLYSGFMTYGYTVMNCPLPVVNMPISGKESLDTMEADITKFKSTVLISNVFIATRLGDYMRQKGRHFPDVRLILYTGESFYKDLRPLYRTVFPNATIRPLAYASVECKIMAFPELNMDHDHRDDDVDPLYRVCSAAVVLEIILDDGTPTKTAGQRGTVVVTNLLKRLQPTIRYPAGDLAEWVDYKAGLFRLRGRSGVGLKVGAALLNRGLIRELVTNVVGEAVADSFQTIVRRRERQNTVTFRIAAEPPPNAAEVTQNLEIAIAEASPAWSRNRDEGHIGAVEVEWVSFKDLIFLEASGKLKDIVDERF